MFETLAAFHHRGRLYRSPSTRGEDSEQKSQTAPKPSTNRHTTSYLKDPWAVCSSNWLSEIIASPGAMTAAEEHSSGQNDEAGHFSEFRALGFYGFKVLGFRL